MILKVNTKSFRAGQFGKASEELLKTVNGLAYISWSHQLRKKGPVYDCVLVFSMGADIEATDHASPFAALCAACEDIPCCGKVKVIRGTR